MTNDEKAEFVAKAMKEASAKSASGTPAQRKKAYRLAIWEDVENAIKSESLPAPLGLHE